MIKSILQILGTGLSLWNHKEKTKYHDKFIKLQKEFYEEYNKPDGERSDAALDNIEFELRLLASGFCAEVRESQDKNM